MIFCVIFILPSFFVANFIEQGAYLKIDEHQQVSPNYVKLHFIFQKFHWRRVKQTESNSNYYFVFSVGMEDTTLTLEQIEHVSQVPREFSSVRIREFDDSTANPEPIAQDEEADQLLEEFLSPSKLVGFSNFFTEKNTPH